MKKTCAKPCAVHVASFPDASHGAPGVSFGMGQVDRKREKERKMSIKLITKSSL